MKVKTISTEKKKTEENRDILAYHQVYFGHQGRTQNVDIKLIWNVNVQTSGASIFF